MSLNNLVFCIETMNEGRRKERDELDYPAFETMLIGAFVGRTRPHLSIFTRIAKLYKLFSPDFQDKYLKAVVKFERDFLNLVRTSKNPKFDINALRQFLVMNSCIY